MAVIIVSKEKKNFRVDIAPLIDVVFLLLVFFMLTFAITGQGIDLSLPNEDSGNATKEKPLIINISEKERILLDGHGISLNSMLDELSGKLEIRSNKLVVVEASKNTRYELFANILDIARQAGAQDFSIVM